MDSLSGWTFEEKLIAFLSWNILVSFSQDDFYIDSLLLQQLRSIVVEY